jgi:predicted AlkP superfamily pyrophosphatase or phosphodiesterase
MPLSSRSFALLAAFFSVALWLPMPASGEPQERPKLVLQITVDQLRADLLWRFHDSFADGGFRYLLENGTVYDNAHHAHANTETIVGHATLATGAHPSVHGMVANVWYDRATGHTVYNIEDPRYSLLSSDAGVDKKTEIDPTQKAARSDGRSPAAIRVSTFSDELVQASNGRSRAFGVSIKDRGAVSMAGHGGKAFWFSKKSGDFVTSNYYYDSYPEWVASWNEKQAAQAYAEKTWELMGPKSSYLFGDSDDRPWEVDLAGFKRTFPHPYGKGDSKYFHTLLTLSPAGDDLTLNFTLALMQAEKVGQGKETDYLAVSFSSTDYVGHLFGPGSLESEDNLRRLDRSIAKLLAEVDKTVGLDKTLIVLSADHGAPDAPEFLNQFGMEAKYADPSKWDKTPAFEALDTRFGISESLILSYEHPYLNLDREAIARRGLNQAEVESAVAEELLKFPSVAEAIPSTKLRAGALPPTPLNKAILNNYNQTRSGDIYVVFEPHHFINDFDGLTVASTHGSPWAYDTYVPMIITGPGIESQRIHRRVETVDLAPTLSNLLKVKQPSGSQGSLLVEVLGH